MQVTQSPPSRIRNSMFIPACLFALLRRNVFFCSSVIASHALDSKLAVRQVNHQGLPRCWSSIMSSRR
jgi:hypothetical protein